MTGKQITLWFDLLAGVEFYVRFIPRADVERHMYVSCTSPLRLLVKRLAYTELVALVGTCSLAL